MVVGENFRFGHKAAGDVSALSHLGATFGFTAHGIPLLRDGQTPLSATYVRSCVQAGDMAGAAHALGRPHRVDGIVERGDQRGAKLGFPTANLRTDAWAAVPADGVYAPNKRAMLKIKHTRTADVVLAGYRLHKTSTPSAPLLGSLLLGLWDESDDGPRLQFVGVAASFSATRRPN